MTAPITIAGLLLQRNAEILATIVMVQLINPSISFFYGTVNGPMDSIWVMLLGMQSKLVSLSLYHLNLRGFIIFLPEYLVV